MPGHPTRKVNLSGFRWLWKPALATVASGTTVAVWLDEILLYAEEILGLIFLPILAGLIYLFDNYLFNCTRPKPADIDRHPEKDQHANR